MVGAAYILGLSLGWLVAVVCLVALVAIIIVVRLRPTPEGVGYEVKFLLDEHQVLDGDHLLKAGFLEGFGIDATTVPDPIEVLYIETRDRDFQSQGWSNRLRIKQVRKKVRVECTHKWRTAVDEADVEGVASALERARELGIPTFGPRKWEVDWGCDKMTLSASFAKNAKGRGISSLGELTLRDALAYASSAMPDVERDWTRIGWGGEQLERAQVAGPLTFHRYMGRLDQGKGDALKVTFEIWPLPQGGSSVEYCCELSLVARGYERARTAREVARGMLGKKGILLDRDSLKTGTVLNAYLGAPRRR